MRIYNKNNGRDFDRQDRPQMHQAVCSNCGKSCEVPFRPTGSKPVLCRDCFRGNQGSDSRRSDSRNSGRSNFEDRQMFDAVCANCGTNCKIPFEPRNGRPVFCSKCFETNGDQDSRRPEGRTFERSNFAGRNENSTYNNVQQPNYKEQFDALNNKLDKILHLLTPVTDMKASEIAETLKEEFATTSEDSKPKKKAKAVKKTSSAKKKKSK